MKKIITSLILAVIISFPKTCIASNFQDITGHWAHDAFKSLTKASILQGYPDGLMRPENHLTYAEAAAIVNSLLGLSPQADLARQWYAVQFEAAREYGLFTDSAINPSAPIRFGELVKILSFLCVHPDTFRVVDLSEDMHITRSQFADIFMQTAGVVHTGGSLTNKSFPGSLLLMGNDASLDNVSIAGNIYIMPGGLRKSLAFSGVTVQGSVYVLGNCGISITESSINICAAGSFGGFAPTISFSKTSVCTLRANCDLTIEMDGVSKIASVVGSYKNKVAFGTPSNRSVHSSLNAFSPDIAGQDTQDDRKPEGEDIVMPSPAPSSSPAPTPSPSPTLTPSPSPTPTPSPSPTPTPSPSPSPTPTPSPSPTPTPSPSPTPTPSPTPIPSPTPTPSPSPTSTPSPSPSPSPTPSEPPEPSPEELREQAVELVNETVTANGDVIGLLSRADMQDLFEYSFDYYESLAAILPEKTTQGASILNAPLKDQFIYDFKSYMSSDGFTVSSFMETMAVLEICYTLNKVDPDKTIILSGKNSGFFYLTTEAGSTSRVLKIYPENINQENTDYYADKGTFFDITYAYYTLPSFSVLQGIDKSQISLTRYANKPENLDPAARLIKGNYTDTNIGRFTLSVGIRETAGSTNKWKIALQKYECYFVFYYQGRIIGITDMIICPDPNYSGN